MKNTKILCFFYKMYNLRISILFKIVNIIELRLKQQISKKQKR